jgi:hypothetical protein
MLLMLPGAEEDEALACAGARAGEAPCDAELLLLLLLSLSSTAPCCWPCISLSLLLLPAVLLLMHPATIRDLGLGVESAEGFVCMAPQWQAYQYPLLLLLVCTTLV